MARNMPYLKMKYGKGNLFYAWMYAPEANATTETWEQVFGDKSAAVPALYDGVHMPSGLVGGILASTKATYGACMSGYW